MNIKSDAFFNLSDIQNQGSKEYRTWKARIAGKLFYKLSIQHSPHNTEVSRKYPSKK